MHAATTSAPSTSASRGRYVPIAVAATVLHAVAMIPGYAEGDGFMVGEFLSIIAISLAVSLAVFLLAVPKGGAVTSVVLGVLALVSSLVFWALLTGPLAAAAAVIGLRERQLPERRGLATAGLALAALAVVALLGAIITDGVS